MILLRVSVAWALAAVLVSAAWAQDKKAVDKTAENKQKIVGVWTLVEGGVLPPGATGTIEFAKDGKMTLTMKLGNQAIPIKGTYEISGDTLTMTREEDGDAAKRTIKALTDKELVLIGEEGEEKYKKN